MAFKFLNSLSIEKAARLGDSERGRCGIGRSLSLERTLMHQRMAEAQDVDVEAAADADDCASEDPACDEVAPIVFEIDLRIIDAVENPILNDIKYDDGIGNRRNHVTGRDEDSRESSEAAHDSHEDRDKRQRSRALEVLEDQDDPDDMKQDAETLGRRAVIQHKRGEAMRLAAVDTLIEFLAEPEHEMSDEEEDECGKEIQGHDFNFFCCGYLLAACFGM